MYRIHFAGRAERAFRKLSPDVQRRLDPAILALADDPRPPGCLKLSGPDSLWRIRVGDYRIVYQIQDQMLLILVVNVGHRREIYR
jgi:mRNA interferase RelE/StbE